MPLPIEVATADELAADQRAFVVWLWDRVAEIAQTGIGGHAGRYYLYTQLLRVAQEAARQPARVRR